MSEEFLVQERLMNKALEKLPNSSYKDLYRIENLTETQITLLYKEGNIITSKAFTSSTYSEEALIDAMRARSYTLLIRIKGKSGKLIEDLSTLKNEREILFKSKTKFKITKVDYSANPEDDYMSKIRTIWIEEL